VATNTYVRGVCLLTHSCLSIQPCVLARVFACHSLYVDNSSSHEQSASVTKLSPALLAFIRALVHIEAVSLMPAGEESPIKRQKRVHFDGSDCSALLPPVDRVRGTTESHQHDVILALADAKEQIENLVNAFPEQNDVENQKNCQSEETTASLDDLINFFGEDGCLRGVGEIILLQECAKAVGMDYPPKRVIKIVKKYHMELSLIRDRLVAPHYSSSMTPLLLERRLSDAVGQAIRYALRKLLNAAPAAITSKDEVYAAKLDTFSKVPSIVSFAMADGEPSRVADDGSISVFISSALCSLCRFFGLNQLVSETSVVALSLPKVFSPDRISNLGFNVRKRVIARLKDDELQEVLSAIRYANSFLAAANACKFLVSLWTAPGVKDEIDRQGGWSNVEMYAALSRKHDLWKFCHDDEHLVALCNYEALLQRLQTYLPVMQPLVDKCENGLMDLAERFHTNTRGMNTLNKFPQIVDIANCLRERHRLPVHPEVNP
jgi:hypothetical protein